ncbi:MAG: response regulator [Candidatus Omnitrophica bacterium]|nr:response regulator [Candidatus Omnitrophota bacterium]
MARKILIVDDDKHVLKSLENLLKREKYEVVAIDDGLKAVEIAKRETFDLIIVDIRMPNLNGIEIIKRIKKYQEETNVSKSEFMIITGYADEDAPKESILLGINTFILKPFETEAFLNAVRNCIESRKIESLIVKEEEKKETPIRLPHKYFSIEKTVLLGQTNLMGNTYFATYIIWQGEVRESILMIHPNFAEEMEKNKHIKMITHSLYHRFVQETTLYDIVEIRMTTREIKRCSLVLVFRYYNKNTNAFLGEGWQRITFFDSKTGTLTTIPEFIRELAFAICEDGNLEISKFKENK